MGTWIKETNTAIYLMEGNYYLEKISKVVRPNGEAQLNALSMKAWFNRADAPGAMVVAVGVNAPEPQPKPVDGGHGGSGSGNTAPKPRVTFIPANPANHRARRAGFDINTILIHNTVFSTESAINRFQTASAQVSAHYIIDRSGEIIQMVADRDCAFHAGNRDVNDRSIGIEHEATQTERGLTRPQEQSSIALIKFLLESYDISRNNIMPHRAVRQTDCPSLIFPDDAAFKKWVLANF